MKKDRFSHLLVHIGHLKIRLQQCPSWCFKFQSCAEKLPPTSALVPPARADQPYEQAQLESLQLNRRHGHRSPPCVPVP